MIPKKLILNRYNFNQFLVTLVKSIKKNTIKLLSID